MNIEGYENYEVTCSGEVINTKTGRVLKPRKEKNGYLQVNLCKKGKRKAFLVHRLVAEAFIPNPENLPEVNHRDEDKTNNFVGTPENNYTDGNLEWCTHEYNINYGTRTEKTSKPVLQLEKDGSLVRVWKSTMEIQRQLGYSRGNISNVCRGEYRSAYGYKWCYA